jgi:formate hydrogenlyase subunit 6/NADH:ubiquinone oxidoreductase subunit I
MQEFLLEELESILHKNYKMEDLVYEKKVFLQFQKKIKNAQIKKNTINTSATNPYMDKRKKN